MEDLEDELLVSLTAVLLLDEPDDPEEAEDLEEELLLWLLLLEELLALDGLERLEFEDDEAEVRLCAVLEEDSSLLCEDGED